ncbi:12491_t:CDS:2, partial [Racocetra persica]
NVKQEGEALEFLQSLPDKSVALAFFDPQYEKVGDKNPQTSRKFTDKSFPNVWKEESLSTQRRKHPHQKPFYLIRTLINATTQEGDLIVDPCAGSFIVLDACQDLGRDFIEYLLNSEGQIVAVEDIDPFKYSKEQQATPNNYEELKKNYQYLSKKEELSPPIEINEPLPPFSLNIEELPEIEPPEDDDINKEPKIEEEPEEVEEKERDCEVKESDKEEK